MCAASTSMASCILPIAKATVGGPAQQKADAAAGKSQADRPAGAADVTVKGATAARPAGLASRKAPTAGRPTKAPKQRTQEPGRSSAKAKSAFARLVSQLAGLPAPGAAKAEPVPGDAAAAQKPQAAQQRSRPRAGPAGQAVRPAKGLATPTPAGLRSGDALPLGTPAGKLSPRQAASSATFTTRAAKSAKTVQATGSRPPGPQRQPGTLATKADPSPGSGTWGSGTSPPAT